jgi:hypothetical protein
MQVQQLLKLGRGAVVELDRKVGEPVDILVNNRLVARGEVVEILAHVALNTFTNYFNEAFKTEIDFPVVNVHNVRKAA